MAKLLAVGVCGILAVALVAGCQSSDERMQAQAMEMTRQLAEQQMAMARECSQQCVGYGCVCLQSKPAGAQLLIDGAEILNGDAESLMIPLGVHEFTACWPDGQKATRKVYVPQMQVNYDIKYNLDASSSGGGIKYSGNPKVEKTEIVLTKPADSTGEH